MRRGGSTDGSGPRQQSRESESESESERVSESESEQKWSTRTVRTPVVPSIIRALVGREVRPTGRIRARDRRALERRVVLVLVERVLVLGGERLGAQVAIVVALNFARREGVAGAVRFGLASRLALRLRHVTGFVVVEREPVGGHLARL